MTYSPIHPLPAGDPVAAMVVCLVTGIIVIAGEVVDFYYRDR